MLGRVKRLEDGNNRYIKILKKNFPPNFKLKGIKIVLDCANGAGYIAAPKRAPPINILKKIPFILSKTKVFNVVLLKPNFSSI